MEQAFKNWTSLCTPSILSCMSFIVFSFSNIFSWRFSLPIWYFLHVFLSSSTSYLVSCSYVLIILFSSRKLSLILINFSRQNFIRGNNSKVIWLGIYIFLALFLVRLMGQAGHKVIVVDNDITDGFSMTRFSRYVDKYINLSGSKSKSGYIEDLLFVWEKKKIDWFLAD